MGNYTRAYNPQPTQRVGSAELKAEFQAIENAFTTEATEAERTLRQSGGSAVNALPNAASRALKVLSFDASGHPVTAFSKADIDSQASAAAASALAADASADDASNSASASSASALAASMSEAAAAASAVAADASADAAAASAASISGGPVTSVNGMTGVVTGLATAASVAAKQDTLVSGTNIKTVGGVSLLGSGNVDISAPASGLTLIATLTPTAAANVDALTVFSSTYDDYLILMDGVKNATGQQEMVLRFAVAGTVDAGANYATVFGAPGAGSGGGDVYGWASNTNDSTGKGCSTHLHVANVNASVGLKTVNGFGWTDDKASGTVYRSTSVHTAYFANNAVSGIRFYWQSGSNFSAQGTIRIYGYSKT